MIINPFDINNKNIVKNQIDSVEIDEIIKYISTNYSKYLSTQNKEFFEGKIKEYIFFKYSLDKEYDYKEVIDKVLNKIFGYGILQKYIDNSEVTDIRVVKYDLIYIKKNGIWIKIKEKFKDREEFRDYIKYCAVKNNYSINFDSPLVIMSDTEYKLRIEAGISPINSLEDNLIIRIHRYNKNLKLNNLIKEEMLDYNSFYQILNMIKNHNNIIIAGKGGSGKTTLLRAILSQYDNNIPITVCEETNELFIENKNIVQREIGINKISDNIDLNILLKHCMVMSNDVIVVGELKGEETAVFVDAMNTGHIGISTVHADSINTVIDRLVILFKRDEKTQKYSETFIKNILYGCINKIIFMKDYKVSEIGEVTFDAKEGIYIIKSIYKKQNE